MRERREARIGTVSGLALLAGGTAVAAVAGGAHSIFATLLLGLLALLMGHSLLVEIQRQARRLTPGWGRPDTVNALLLAAWAETALISTILIPGSMSLRAVGLTLGLGYAGGCGYFVTERRRVLSTVVTPPRRAALPAPQARTAESAGHSHSEEPAQTPSAAQTPTAGQPAQVGKPHSGGQDHDDRRDRHAVRLDR